MTRRVLWLLWDELTLATSAGEVMILMPKRMKDASDGAQVLSGFGY